MKRTCPALTCLRTDPDEDYQRSRAKFSLREGLVKFLKPKEEEKVLNFPEKKDTMHQMGPDIPSLPVDSTKEKGKC